MKLKDVSSVVQKLWDRFKEVGVLLRPTLAVGGSIHGIEIQMEWRALGPDDLGWLTSLADEHDLYLAIRPLSQDLLLVALQPVSMLKTS